MIALHSALSASQLFLLLTAAGRSDVNDHIATKKHKVALNARARCSTLAKYYATKQPDKEEYNLAAAEGTYAYHTIRHNQSVRSMDSTSQLIREMFESQFTWARTETEAILTNVLAPLSIHLFEQDLANSMFVSVSVDASNHNSVTFLPVVVRHFVPSGPNSGIKNKILTFSSVKKETSEVLCDHIVDVLENFSLNNKVIAFSAVNTNLQILQAF
jgi:hypothetical protein